MRRYTTVFRAAVDDMAFLRGTAADETAVFDTVADAQVMTMVAYAGNGTSTVRSDPRIVRSLSGSATLGGEGVGRVNSLTLIARFDEGSLQYLQWHDMGCGACRDGDECLKVGDGHTACAGAEEACSCTGDNCALDLSGTDALRCHLTVSAAFSGRGVHCSTSQLIVSTFCGIR
jgi:hypothetical protein